MSLKVFGQTVSCPPNLDFEFGNFTNWNLFTGSCCPIVATNLTGALPNRHVITSGTATDPYGGFPVVAPGSGVYSLKLGNNSVNSQAERARYYAHVPSGVNNYSIIFRYAVVFQDPGHLTSEQPRFEVKAYDSATNTIIPCSQFIFVATSNLPGFQLSTITSNASVWYKSWTTASIDLSGYAGKTVAIDFASGDCDLGAHFGYGYVDLNCGLLPTNTVVCSNSPTFTITAPPGFAHYEWRDSTLTTIVDTNQTATITTPANSTQYAVILTPYTGFGCPDTIFTKVTVSKVNVNINNNDTTICNGTTLQLNTTATATSTPITYSWTPATGLSCTSCANPVVTLPVNTKYYVTAGNGDNCTTIDSIRINSSNISIALTKQNDSCFNQANGTMTAVPAGGKIPYVYSWNTTPVQNTPTATGLAAGIYTVTITDSVNCTKTATDTIKQPALLAVSTAKTNVSCYGGSNGSAVATPSGGTAPYTYSWNTSPVKTTATATGLSAGTYTVTVTDAHNCTATATVTVNQPAQLTAVTVKTNVTCYNGTNGTATVTASGGTAPYAYSWNTTPVKTTAIATGLSVGTYTVTVTDSQNCAATATATITQPTQLIASAAKTDVSCYGGNDGTATVTASGGTGTYTYSWNTIPVKTTSSINNLVTGTYTVTVTDSNNCTATATATVGQPALLTVTATKTDVPCNSGSNGTATANVSGSTAPYTYSWNTSPVQSTATATGLTAGVYTVTVTDSKGCIKTAIATIAQPTPLAVVATKTDVSCNGGNNGTAIAVASGGVTPYNYSWNSNPVQTTATATGLPAGNYTVTITDSNNCTAAANITIGQPIQLSVSATKTDVSCYNGLNGTAIATPNGGIAPYSYSWNTIPVQTGATATNLASGTYTVTITDNKNCTSTASVTVNQPTAISAIINKTNVSCHSGSNGTATVVTTGGTAPYTYIWNTLPVQTGTTATGLIAGTYTVTITDAKGCLLTASQAITQPTALTSSATKTDVSCNNGSNGSATVVAAGGTIPYTYSWNTTPVQTSATATGLSSGTYSVTVTDANGCTSLSSITIGQPGQLTATATKTDVSCHDGSNGTATVVANGGSTPYTYSWNTTPVQTTTTATGLQAGTYTVTVIDGKGCNTTANATVGQPLAVSGNTTATNASCFGGSNGSTTITASGGTAPYTYSWNTSPAQTTATATGLAAGSYTVTITDAKGCTGTASATIGQPTQMAYSLVKTDVSCFGDSNGTATITLTGGTATYSYGWLTAPVQTTATAVNLKAGTYIAHLKDAHNCFDSAIVTISEPPLLVATTNKTNVDCFGGSNGTATVNASGGTGPYTYAWNTSPVQTTNTATGLQQGKYTVTVMDSHGCTTTAITDSLQQPPELKLTAAPDKATCPEAANGSAIANASGGVGPYAYSWNTNPLQTNATATGLYAGTYTVTTTDAHGCVTSTTVNVLSLPSPVVDAGADQTMCLGKSVKLIASGASTYIWSPAGTLSCYNCISPIATPSGTTIYQVIGADTNNCHDTDEVQVNVIPRVDVFVGPDIDICIGDPVQLHASGGQAYQWIPPYNLNNEYSSDPVSTTDTSMIYKVVITENQCFKDTLHQSATIHKRPTVDLGPDKRGVPGATIQLHADTANTINIAWSPKMGLDCYDCYNPLATLTKTITYTAVVSSGVCEAKDDITIIVACDNALFFIPNTFTPNGDGKNDRFWPSAQGVTNIDRFLVYDRWGEKIYEAYNFPPNDEHYGWDGTFRSNPLAPDVYVYYLEAKCSNGEKIFLKGDISLVR